MIGLQTVEFEEKMKNLKIILIALMGIVLLSSSSMAQEWGNLKFKFTYGGEYQAPAKIDL